MEENRGKFWKPGVRVVENRENGLVTRVWVEENGGKALRTGLLGGENCGKCGVTEQKSKRKVENIPHISDIDPRSGLLSPLFKCLVTVI